MRRPREAVEAAGAKDEVGCADTPLAGDAVNKVTEKVKEEVKALLPPVIFFFVALHIVAIIRTLMVEGTGIAVATSLSVTVAALVMGKVVLIADMLPIINRYPEKPLAYNVIWKTAIYTVLSLLIHYLEHLIDHWRATGSLVEGNRELFATIVWPHLWAIQILLVVMIFSYCTVHELARAMGRERMLKIFFGTPEPAVVGGKPASQPAPSC
jgi:hypothetical protein